MEESGSLSLTFTSIDNKHDVAWFSFTEDGEAHKDDKDKKILSFAANGGSTMSYKMRVVWLITAIFARSSI